MTKPSNRSALLLARDAEALIQNPTIEIEHKPVARFRVRGFGIREVDDPVLVRLLTSGGSPPNPHVAAALVEAGLVVPKDQAPSEVRFRARLGFRLPRLFPKEAKGDSVPQRLVLNPHIQWQSFPNSRCPVRKSSTTHLASGTRLWVTDPSTGISFPYWPDVPLTSTVRSLQQGTLDVHSLDTQQRRVLHLAGILLSPQAVNAASARASRTRRLSQQLAKSSYAVVHNLVSPLQVSFLRQYFRELEREGYLTRGDNQVERRHVMYREPLSSLLHEQMNPFIGDVTGSATRASYSYFGVYLPGALLQKHKDRPQCQWNLSLIWDTRPERPRDAAWPLYLDVNGNTHEIKLAMGDALLYRGTEHFHWRERQPARNRTTATFFHFVARGFEGSID